MVIIFIHSSKCARTTLDKVLYNVASANMKNEVHTVQVSRFERETPDLRDHLLSSRLISKSPVLRETSPNFQFFLKFPIWIASYFVFWCFNCVTAIGNVKNTLSIHVNSLFLQWFIIDFAKHVLKNGKIIIFLNWF